MKPVDHGAPGDAGLAPVQPGQRLASLDLLRGFALLGIFLVNIPLFSFPVELGLTPGDTLESTADRISVLLVAILAEGKFISLFSLLFGAGVTIQWMRARARNTPFAGMYVRRLLVLLCFGLIHAIGFWYGDILVLYACLGFVLLPLLKLSPRNLLITAGVLLTVCIVLMSLLAFFQALGKQFPLIAPTMEEGGELLTGLQAIETYPWASEQLLAAESNAYAEGPLADALAFRVMTWGFFIVMVFFSYAWHVMTMFLVGTAMIKVGFFDPSRILLQKKAAIMGLSIGLPLEILDGFLFAMRGFTHGWTSIASAFLSEIGTVSIAIGFAGLGSWLVSSGGLTRVVGWICSVGRMALTNYLLQTLVATTIMYWWGFGMFGSVERSSLVLLVLGFYVLQVIFSVAWLQVFQMGPFEWLWRTITYLRPPALLRRN